ncbi:pyridoxal phosphate-dependent aminotransferase [Enterobacter ludwigii]|uniref:pyridoxal phosphate-dependent aminotransferase n=1 Tax=Enterobacter ludwigii TaxID=299767 RepID=UPI00397569A4
MILATSVTPLPRLSRLASQLEYSDIIHLAVSAQHAANNGKAMCDMIIGDFDTTLFPLPTTLNEAIKQAYDSHQHDYPPLEGVLPLRQNLAQLMRNHFNLNYDPEREILISGGARPLLYLALMALVDPNEKILYPTPSWNNNYYATLCRANGISIETSPANRYLPVAADFIPHLSGARVICLCSPQNPVGAMFSQQQLTEICDLVLEENMRRQEQGEKPLYLLFDQVYWMLTYQQNTHFHPVALRPELKPWVIVVDGASKAFSATGLRVGWGMGPADIIHRMAIMQEHIGAIAPKAEQLAMASMLGNENLLNTHLSSFKEQIYQSLIMLHSGIQQLKSEGYPVESMEPVAGIYLSLKIDLAGKITPDGKVIENEEQAARYLIEHAGFAVVPFSCFGMHNAAWWFRAAVCAVRLEDIELVLPAVRLAIGALK